MRILLADDHALFRAGLKLLLETEIEGAAVVAEAGNGLEAVALTAELDPDIVLMDISMPLLSGLEAMPRIKKAAPRIKVIILSQYLDKAYVDQAITAGASGYVNKDAVFDEIRIALQAAQNNQFYLTPCVTLPIINGYLKTTPEEEITAAFNSLTPREKEVFQLLAKGCNRLNIGSCLGISPKTVDIHRLKMLRKLKISEVDIADFAKKIRP